MIRILPISLLTICILTAATLPAQQAPSGNTEIRTWTSHDGKHTTRAKYSGFELGKVRIVKEDGSAVEVPLIGLSEEDHKYVRSVAEDNAEAIETLSKQNVELKPGDKGRIVEATFPRNRRVDRREIELLSSLASLERLSLAQTRIAEGALDEIRHLVGLRELDLTATPIGNPEVRQLTGLTKLEALSLSDTRITNRALSYLKELPKLKELALANTRIGDDGIANLEELKTLKTLNLGNTRVSPQGVLRLRKSLPNTEMAGSGVVRRR